MVPSAENLELCLVMQLPMYANVYNQQISRVIVVYMYHVLTYTAVAKLCTVLYDIH